MSSLQLDLAGYVFGEKIADGGMASVYHGTQLSLHRPVAIKVLSQKMQAESVAREAFERESLIIAQLNHPNIIHIIDKGITSEGTPFFIMEYIDGQDLGRLMRSGEVPPMRRVEICLQICKALAYAHKNGVVHRDIKPANILVDKELNAKVLDFGIALYSEGDEPPDEATEVMGTLRYMAPELQQSTRMANTSSDIYSLGILMFELFTGQRPVVGQSIKEQGSKLPPRLERLIDSCLAIDPDGRPNSFMGVHNQLLQLLRGSHLNQRQAAKAKDAVDKKTFTLLDILSDSDHGSLYLFQENTTAAQVLVRKCERSTSAYEAGRKLAELSHPNIVRVHGVSKNERATIVVTDFLPGGSLQDRLIRPASLENFLPLARQICAGLSFAHKHDIYHRNLDASNVLFGDNGTVKITGFGIAHREDAEVGDTISSLSEARSKIAVNSPEKIDLFDCAVIFYRMLVGERPRWYLGRLQEGKAFMRLPEVLRLILVKMLGANARESFKSASEVAAQLEQLNEELTTLILPAAKPAVGVVKEKKKLLLLLLLVLFFLTLLNTSVLMILGLDNDIIQALRVSFRSLFQRGT